jgi:ABC-type glycerol-3-phosphate transport system permease component
MILEKIKGNSVWFIAIIISIIILKPAIQEINTILIVIISELLALALSSLAAYVYTELDFKEERDNNLGYIFLGVHLCVGLSVIGTYIAQF